MDVRPRHIENAATNNQKGILKLAGAMVEDFVPVGQVPNFKGSVLLVAADTKEECLEILNADVYVKNNVWDMDKAQILPFMVAFWPTAAS